MMWVQSALVFLLLQELNWTVYHCINILKYIVYTFLNRVQVQVLYITLAKPIQSLLLSVTYLT